MAKRIVVMRHPERKVEGAVGADEISPHGAEQAWAMASKLKSLGYVFTYLVYSGLKRTLQTARLMAAAFDLPLNTELVKVEAFDFTLTLKTTVKDSTGFKAEVARMKALTGTNELTVAQALEHSEYARRGQKIVTSGLFVVAGVMTDGETALVLSHSPWTELAAVDPAAMPYGIGEADAIVYTIDGDRIVASQLLKAPLPGGKHT